MTMNQNTEQRTECITCGDIATRCTCGPNETHEKCFHCGDYSDVCSCDGLGGPRFAYDPVEDISDLTLDAEIEELEQFENEKKMAVELAIKNHPHNDEWEVRNQFNYKYWYAHGNIVRTYTHPYRHSFWLCVWDDNRPEERHFHPDIKLWQCDERGVIVPNALVINPVKTWVTLPSGRQIEVPSPDGWVWLNVNEVKHPTFEKIMARNRAIYDACTDADWLKRERLGQLKSIKHEQFYASLTDFEKELFNFDWTFHEADRPSQANPGGYEREKDLVERLLKLPVAQAQATWKKAGSARYNYHNMRPDWTQCPDWVWPDCVSTSESYQRKVTHTAYKDNKVIDTFEENLETFRGHPRSKWDLQGVRDWFNKFDANLPMYNDRGNPKKETVKDYRGRLKDEALRQGQFAEGV